MFALTPHIGRVDTPTRSIWFIERGDRQSSIGDDVVKPEDLCEIARDMRRPREERIAESKKAADESMKSTLLHLHD